MSSVSADDTGSEHHDFGGVDSGNTAEQDAKAAVRMFQAVGSGLNRHASGDLGHRREQGKAAMGRSDRLVRNADRAAFHQIGSLVGIWCEV